MTRSIAAAILALIVFGGLALPARAGSLSGTFDGDSMWVVLRPRTQYGHAARPGRSPSGRSLWSAGDGARRWRSDR